MMDIFHISTNNLLALCYLPEDDNFYNDLSALLCKKGYTKLVRGLNRMKNHPCNFNYPSATCSFYTKYSQYINIIEKYSNLHDFLLFQDEDNIDYFRKYIKVNHENLDKIINLAKRLMNMQISEIKIVPAVDEMVPRYIQKDGLDYNQEISYFDSMNFIHQANHDDMIMYQGYNATYEIRLSLDYMQPNVIYTSTLLFDINLLPAKIEKNYIWKQIVEQSLKTSYIDNYYSMLEFNEDIDQSIKALSQAFNHSNFFNIELKNEKQNELKEIRKQLQRLKSTDDSLKKLTK